MKAKPTRWPAVFALVAYSAVLILFVVFKAIPTIHIGHRIFRFAGARTGPGNFVPFKTITSLLLGGGNRLIAKVNLLGNILPFMPIGFLAPLVYESLSWPKAQSMSWRKALVLGIMTGLTCEVMEVVFRVGIFDVDDLILNALGVVLGYGVLVVLRRGRQRRMG